MLKKYENQLRNCPAKRYHGDYLGSLRVVSRVSFELLFSGLQQETSYVSGRQGNGGRILRVVQRLSGSSPTANDAPSSRGDLPAGGV